MIRKGEYMVVDPAWREEVETSDTLLPVGLALPADRFVHDPRPLRSLDVNMDELAHKSTTFSHNPAKGIRHLAAQLELLRAVKEKKIRSAHPAGHPAAHPALSSRTVGGGDGVESGRGRAGIGEWLSMGGEGLLAEFMRVNPEVGRQEAIDFLADVV